jgi:hypothetical protein
MTTPYTYLIGWPELDTWYYGVRWRPGCDPSDLWVKYFTSSKYVKIFREQHGEPSVISIRKTFVEPKKAREWEHRFLARIKADVNPKFLNKTTNNVPTMSGRKQTEETKMKIKLAQIGKPKNPQSVQKMRKTQLLRIASGYSDSEETRKKKSVSHLGVKKSEVTREIIRTLKTGKHHWTNGTAGKYCVDCPGVGWVRGKISHKQKGSRSSLNIVRSRA